jgi:uncharacterized protein (TIGR00251 family)
MNLDDLTITAGTGGVRLAVRVVPRASRSAVAGVRGGRLMVRVTAPPVEGAANEAVLDVIAGAVGVPRRAVSLLAGETQRDKTVVIVGVTETDVRRRLQGMTAAR